MRRRDGFTLLELMTALAIFLIIAAATMEITDGANDLAIEARTSRELRYLAEYKLEQIKVFEEEFDDILTGDFGDFDDEDTYADYEWELGIDDMTVFGINSDEEAQYYWEAPDKDEEQPQAGAAPNQGKPEVLREITLTVTAPESGGQRDSIKVITLLPTVEYKR